MSSRFLFASSIRQAAGGTHRALADLVDAHDPQRQLRVLAARVQLPEAVQVLRRNLDLVLVVGLGRLLGLALALDQLVEDQLVEQVQLEVEPDEALHVLQLAEELRVELLVVDEVRGVQAAVGVVLGPNVLHPHIHPQQPLHRQHLLDALLQVEQLLHHDDLHLQALELLHRLYLRHRVLRQLLRQLLALVLLPEPLHDRDFLHGLAEEVDVLLLFRNLSVGVVVRGQRRALLEPLAQVRDVVSRGDEDRQEEALALLDERLQGLVEEDPLGLGQFLRFLLF